ncbi:hypothetical protein ACMSSJ_11470 [Kerstersia gyiorum]|uniref:hypothetical protein n=1 Tax=Kerstersia gyiorum TaxID=206506 RepID=UPI0039EC5C86
MKLAIAAVIGAAVSSILVYVWITKGMNSSEMASWVQAIGVFFAIAVTSYVSRADLRYRRENEREKENVQVEIFIALSENLLNQFRALRDASGRNASRHLLSYFEKGVPIQDAIEVNEMIRSHSLNACVRNDIIGLIINIRQSSSDLISLIRDANFQYRKHGCVPYSDDIDDDFDFLEYSVRELKKIHILNGRN